MDHWDDLRVLVALSKSGTMTGAARILGTNVATVSRRIERLTDSLGAAPFVRTAEGWRPSQLAMGLIEIASQFEVELGKRLTAAPGADAARQRVPIRIGAPPVISTLVLFPALFRNEEWLSGVALEFSDRLSGDGLGEHDLIVRHDRPKAGGLRTRRVGTLTFRLYGRDANATSDWVGLTEANETDLPMQLGHAHFGRPPVLRVSTFAMLHDVLLRTGLPGPLPDLLARRTDALVALETGLPPLAAEFWLAFRSSRKGEPAIEATVEWVIAAFASA